MSLDLNVYIEDFARFSREACELYMKKCFSLFKGKNVEIKFFSNVDIEKHKGFLPFKITFDSGNSYVSGFEYYIHNYKHSSCDDYENNVNEILSKCKKDILLTVRSGDDLEPILAELFGSYIVENLNGAFYNTWSGEFSIKQNLKGLYSSIKCNIAQFDEKTAQLHKVVA